MTNRSESSPAAHHQFFPIDSWDRYQFLKKLGQGGMSVVYKTWDAQANRIVALKFLRADRGRDPFRLLKEAQAQARISHPGVCQVYEVGQIQKMPYIAMQFIDGWSLQSTPSSLPLETRLLLVIQICQALHEAHQLGIIHRDIKPSNILVEAKGEALLWSYVLDFGLARETTPPDEGESRPLILGTPAYMSPEQARGDELAVSERTDVYGVGAVLYKLLTGRPPFLGASPKYIVSSVLRKRPQPLRAVDAAVPEALEAITLKCLEKEPERRYGSVLEIGEELERFLNGAPVLALKESWSKQLLNKLRRTGEFLGLKPEDQNSRQ